MKEFPRELRDYLSTINPMNTIRALEQRVKQFYCHDLSNPDFQIERKRLFDLFSITKFFPVHNKNIEIQLSLIRMFCDMGRIFVLIVSVLFTLSTLSIVNLKLADAAYRYKSIVTTEYLGRNYPEMDKTVVNDIQDCIVRCHYDSDNSLQHTEDDSQDNHPIIKVRVGSDEDGLVHLFDTLVVYWLGTVLLFSLNPVSYRFNRARRLFWQAELYLREREKMAKSASSVNGATGTNGH